MCSASARLPSRSTLLTSAVTKGEPYTGSVTSGRLVAGPLRGMSALLLLRAIAAAGLLTVPNALRVERTANDLVPDAREVLDPATTHQHDRVLLQVVADSWDVGGDLYLAGQPDPGDLAERGVRLLRRGGVDARAHATALRAALQRRSLVLGNLVLPALADELLDRGHRVSVLCARLRHAVVRALVRVLGRARAFGTLRSVCVLTVRGPACDEVLTLSPADSPWSTDPRGRACRRP